MKKFSLILLLPILTLLPGCDTLQQLANSNTLTSQEIASGLKQALEIGIGEGSDALAKVDGYFKSPYKILLPPEARKVTDKLRAVPGFAQVEEIILEKINRGAEDAASRAKPIFTSAIRSMTFNDALGILMGQKNAATTYLHASTYSPLYTEFHPVIVNSLNKFNAIEYWADAVNTYNKIPFVEKVNPSLDAYVTDEALKGLFGMVEKKELQIRTDISERTTDLLKKVFCCVGYEAGKILIL
jgi:hypothetical protein